MRREMADGIEIGRLARENVILRHGFERFRGETQVHRMSGLARKINREPREHRVHRFDAAKAPAPVRAAAGFRQLRERRNVLAFNFPSCCQFFEFVFHNK